MARLGGEPGPRGATLRAGCGYVQGERGREIKPCPSYELGRFDTNMYGVLKLMQFLFSLDSGF